MKKYLAIAELAANYAELYNSELRRALILEQQRKVLIIAPDHRTKMKTLGKNGNKIIQLYQEGYQKASKISRFLYE